MNNEKFSVKFAQTEEEKRSAYALRYRDMILEYNPTRTNETGLDVNAYDEYAKQIICIDNETGEVVGCYRVIESDLIPENGSFTCDEEFDLTYLKQSGEKIAELSRAVIKKEYRNNVVLMLLLRFVVKYLRQQNYRYIIGSASFFGTDKDKYQKELSYIAHHHAIDDKYRITAKEEKQITLLAETDFDAAEVKHALPPLIRAYLSFGAKMSKQSFTDREFGSIDLFVLLDEKDYNSSYIDKLLKL